MEEHEQQYYYPGSEPVSTDDLIFQIGEKEIDISRKKKAIDTLKEQLDVLIKSNKDLSERLSQYEKEIETD